MRLPRTIACIACLWAGSALADSDVSNLIHLALEQHATLPVRPPTLPDAASSRAQEALQQHGTFQRRDVERAAKRANANAERVVDSKDSARNSAGNRARNAVGVSANVHAAERSAAGQVRAAEVKKATKRPDRP